MTLDGVPCFGGSDDLIKTYGRFDSGPRCGNINSVDHLESRMHGRHGREEIRLDWGCVDAALRIMSLHAPRPKPAAAAGFHRDLLKLTEEQLKSLWSSISFTRTGARTLIH